jgi:hypothetical protein
MTQQEEIAIMFRQVELARRLERRQRLINELKLPSENLTEFDQKINNKAVDQLRKENLRFRALTIPGYWSTLWLALLGRI